MIQHRGMTRSARSKVVQYYFDLSSTTRQTLIVCEPENDVKIQRIDLVYTVATSSHTQTEGIDVGIVGTATKYAAVVPAVDTAAGTVTQTTPSSTDLLTKGTVLTLGRSAHSGSSNTGEVVVMVHYELIDNKVEV